MNRDIKFRAWDLNYKTMVYINDLYWFEEEGVHDFEGSGHYSNYTFMEYTGLKDRNGKKIFESDIIIATTEEGKGIQGYIEYIDCAWMVNIDGITVYEFYNLRYPSIVIIGNRYENPELSEEENN